MDMESFLFFLMHVCSIHPLWCVEKWQCFETDSIDFSHFYLFTGAQLSGGLPDMTLISKLNRCIQLIRKRLSHSVELQ